jgi:hypothetical protein
MEGLTSNQKGAIAEAEICAAAVKHGIPVYKPVAEHGRCDLVLDWGGRLLRIQCKWGSLNGDVIRIWLKTSRHTPRNGYVVTTYDEAEIDAIAAYCPHVDRCYLLPISLVGGRTMIYLRVGPSRNNQSRGLKWARDYDFGAIAQLGERVTGSHEAAGSSPASSTSSPSRY